MKALFDTNVLIDYLKGVEGAAQEMRRYSTRLVSVITRMEILIGARSDEEEDVIEMFLRDFRVVDLTRGVAREAIDLRRDHRIRLPDAVIWPARAPSRRCSSRATRTTFR